ncbi:MAG: hypothetical protein ABSC61_12305, partial [Anaerolineales bacterium]
MAAVAKRRKIGSRGKPIPARRKVRRVAKRRPPIEPLDLRAVPGPETVVRRVLPNGIITLVRENFLSPSVVVLGSLWAGGLDESD